MYGPADYRFDAEALGLCPICGRERCNHCRDCGCVMVDGICRDCELAEMEELEELDLVEALVLVEVPRG